MSQIAGEMKVGEDIAVPEQPSPEQMMAQITAMANEMAALKAEVVQLRSTKRAKDEDSLEYSPPGDAVQELLGSGSAAVQRSPAALRRRTCRSERRKPCRNADVALHDAADPTLGPGCCSTLGGGRPSDRWWLAKCRPSSYAPH